ncbi:RNA pseudouridylate synthase family protein [Aphelenchoides avenae]|nr:RNA pseudouridylate synthase family protein [Aphelenchus avenae]
MAEEDVEHLEKAEDLQPDSIFEEQYFAGTSQSGAGDLHSMLLQHDQQAQRTQQEQATVTGHNVVSDGLDELVEAIEPAWAYSHEQRVQMMTQRVIYETEDLIAFDKPYQMAYSGANKDQAQLDRLLQDIRKVVTPDCDRLHVIASLDKCCSGVVLFAKNAKKQAELRGFLKDGSIRQTFRCLIKGVPRVKQAVISIPLTRHIKAKDVKYNAVTEETRDRRHVFHVKSEYNVINWNETVHASLVDVTVLNPAPSVVHQVRSHLYFGLNCPQVGDKKYSEGASYVPPRMSPNFMHCLGGPPKADRKLPMFMHALEMQIPAPHGKFSVIKAEGVILRVHLRPNCEYHIDKAWSERVLLLVQKSLYLEKTMWELSTLGGALSAMGDFIGEFAERAFVVSLRQRRIAEELGDPELASRCNMYIALSLAQKGHFKLSKRIIR